MKKIILIAEDSISQQKKLEYTLMSNGFVVECANNGVEALKILEMIKPDLVISDIVMPEMDGYALCATIKNSNHLKEIPVMLLTTLTDSADVIKGLQAGADNFLTKPYNDDFLLSRVNYIILNNELRKISPINTNIGLEVVFNNQKYVINSDRIQIIDLLLSTYENAIKKNEELIKANEKLLQMHGEIARKNLELKELNKTKDRFLSIAAHDLRNPIGAVYGFSAILIEDITPKLNEEQNESLRLIKESSEYALNLLNDLLDHSVIDSGELKLTPEKINVIKLIKKCIDYNMIIAHKKSITIDYKIYEEEILLNCDSVKIEQVINNLISNAIKYSKPGSNIKVSVYHTANEVTVSVKDHGEGISESELSKLFQPFQKASSRTTGGERSTGLGLSIVKKIIDSHHGKVSAVSNLGSGSVFSFTLPLNPFD